MSMSVALLRELLFCDAAAGRLYWKPRDIRLFHGERPEAAEKTWNKRFAYHEALASIGASGYRRGAVMSTEVLAHRVIFAMATGSWPVNQIDHINGDRLDNRLCNLREATAEQNKANSGKRPRRNPTSRFIGVHMVGSTGRWGAAVGHQRRNHWAGTFASEEDAAKARDELALRIKGEFARLNFPVASHG